MKIKIFGLLIVIYSFVMISLQYFYQKNFKIHYQSPIYPQQVHSIFIDEKTALIIWSTKSQPDTCKVKIQKMHFQIREYSSLHWGYYIFKKQIRNIPFNQILSYEIYCQKDGFSVQRGFELKTHPGFVDEASILILGDWSTSEIGDAHHTTIPKTHILQPLKQETKNYWSIWHLGDIAYDLHSNQGLRGNQFLRDIEPLVTKTPYMPVVGNHQFYSLFLEFGTRFRSELFYIIQVGKATIVAFNSQFEIYSQKKKYPYQENFLSYLREKQFKELERILKNINRQEFPWLIAMMHTPLYFSKNAESKMMSKVYQNQSPVVRKRFENFLDKFQFDLVFAGHIHLYQRTFPIQNKEVFRDAESNQVFYNPIAPIYIVNGVAGNIQSQKVEFKVTKTQEPFSVIISESLGYGILNILNKTHIHYEQLAFGISQWDPIETDLMATKRVVDEFFIVKT